MKFDSSVRFACVHDYKIGFSRRYADGMPSQYRQLRQEILDWGYKIDKDSGLRADGNIRVPSARRAAP